MTVNGDNTIALLVRQRGFLLKTCIIKKKNGNPDMT